MKKIDLGQTLGIIANLGVIAGIIFLAYELRQNNALLRAQSRATQLSQQSVMLNTAFGPEFIEIIDHLEAGNELTAGQRFKLVGLANMLLDLWQWQYIEYRAGMLDELPIAAMRGWYQGQNPLPAPIGQIWVARSGVFSDDFVELFEENVIRSNE